jgi:hypothetical protein
MQTKNETKLFRYVFWFQYIFYKCHKMMFEMRSWHTRMVLPFYCKLPEPWKMAPRLVAARPKNKMASVGSSRKCWPTIGRSRPSKREMPRGGSKLEAESWQNPPDLENRFLQYIDGWTHYCTDRSFDTAGF